MRGPGALVNAFTVDVEEHFHVAAFEGTVPREDWTRIPSRVERNTERLLELLAAHGIRATFFTLGWVAERRPALIRRIAAAGHEVASHGYDHTRLAQLDPRRLREDVGRARAALEDAAGTAVIGYRAPTFSITRQTLWAHAVLAEAGYRYSSSIYPVRHDLYGIPDAPRFPFRDPDSGILEVPVTTVRLLGHNLPCGGGGFFRAYPYAFNRWCLRRANTVDGQPCVFYTHPWEIDPAQPRPAGLPRRARLRHYLNLERMERRLARLLGDFAWGRMDEVFLPRETAAVALAERRASA